MTDQADDIPPIESVDPQPSPVAPAPLTAVEAVAEALAAIHAREPDLAIDLRDNLRRCSINELVRLFGAPQIVNALLSGASPATMPLEANGEPVEKLSGEGAPEMPSADGSLSGPPPGWVDPYAEECRRLREALERTGRIGKGPSAYPQRAAYFGRPAGATHMSD